ncbi:centaurin-gamma-1A [Trichinella spiralis]|uniref:centaurin-gamma-1A n=1 Tax=Trichinella spiralis TaxID=6334 RepID=UPI0001EFB3B5|nr:centaurin-gamma-1A [Trichinella spiralis]
MSRQYTYDSASTISEQIRNEIQRFESVHPCIYAIYDLLELILDAPLAQQLRENVVQIEDIRGACLLMCEKIAFFPQGGNVGSIRPCSVDRFKYGRVAFFIYRPRWHHYCLCLRLRDVRVQGGISFDFVKFAQNLFHYSRWYFSVVLTIDATVDDQFTLNEQISCGLILDSSLPLLLSATVTTCRRGSSRQQ